MAGVGVGYYGVSVVAQFAPLLGGRRMSYLRLLWIFLRIGAMNELAYRANFWAQLLR